MRYFGEATYLGHHTERRPDKNGDFRNAIVFELDIDADPTSLEIMQDLDKINDRGSTLWTRPLKEVRDIAIRKLPIGSTEKMRRIVTQQRSEAVRIYVLRRAKGICECCLKMAPFITTKGRPYLEPHHIFRLGDGGPDDPRFVAAVCPNCHKKIHYGRNGGALNPNLASIIKDIEEVTSKS